MNQDEEQPDFEKESEEDENADLTESVEQGDNCGNCGGEFERRQAKAALCPDCWKAAKESDRAGFIEADCDTLAF